jgi:very-short-patch-repair endonuclease
VVAAWLITQRGVSTLVLVHRRQLLDHAVRARSPSSGRSPQYAGRLHRLYTGKREVRIYDSADLNVPMLARMFDRRGRGYDAIGYTILPPASAIPGWPADVMLPADPVWKRDYPAACAGPFGMASMLREPLRARCPGDSPRRRRGGAGAERNGSVPFPATGNPRGDQRAIPSQRCAADRVLGRLEVDLLCGDARVAVQLDGAQHLSDPVAYRRDRRKDQLLQESGYLVLRFLAEDVGRELGLVLDVILRSLVGRCRHSIQTTSSRFREGSLYDRCDLPF